MAEVESVLSKVLLSLQLSLAFWQIVKLTAFGGIIKAFASWCLSKLPGSLGTRLSPSYARLEEFKRLEPLERLKRLEALERLELEEPERPDIIFPDSLYKGLREKPAFLFFAMSGVCMTMKEGDQRSVASQASGETEIQIQYLGKPYKIERREICKLFVNGIMTYYITEPIWQSLLNLKLINSDTVFLKGHRVLFGAVITGGVMKLSEVLDGLILRNDIIKPLFRGALVYFLPINMSVSEEKLLKGLNLVGLFLQTKKQMYWLIPVLLSLISAMMEFCTGLRVFIYRNVNRIFCWAMRPLCDRLPLRARVCIYTLLEWVEKFKPSNDFEWREVSGVKSVVIGGGARAYSENASLVPPTIEVWEAGHCKEFFTRAKYPLRVGLIFNGRSVQIRVHYKTYPDLFEEDCDQQQYRSLSTFIDCLMEARSGSLESCEADGSVCRVRSIEESIFCYIRNGFPDVYSLELKTAVIK